MSLMSLFCLDSCIWILTSILHQPYRIGFLKRFYKCFIYKD
jgi:hypothetical protein